METLFAAKHILQKSGYPDPILNMPSATCCQTIPLIKELGGHQGEPGHALTGTTPLHLHDNQPEKIAMVYVSEISHHGDNNSYCYGEDIIVEVKSIKHSLPQNMYERYPRTSTP